MTSTTPTPAEALKALTQAETVKALKESWAYLESDRKKHGVEIMIRLFTVHPQAKEHFHQFKDVPTEELWKSRSMRGHGTTLMYGIQSFMDQLDDPDCLEDLIRKMVVSHLGRNVTSSEFMLLGAPLLQILDEKLGDKSTATTKEAWKKLLVAIISVSDEEKQKLSETRSYCVIL